MCPTSRRTTNPFIYLNKATAARSLRAVGGGGYKIRDSRICHQPFCPRSESRHFRTCCPWLVSTKGKCLKNRSLGRSCTHSDMCTHTSAFIGRKSSLTIILCVLLTVKGISGKKIFFFAAIENVLRESSEELLNKHLLKMFHKV